MNMILNFLFWLSLATAAVSEKLPNVLWIMSDDTGYGDLSSYGSPTILSPNLDNLAETGVKFTQHYAAAPLCTPSRGAALTGRLPGRLGLYTDMRYPMDLLFRVFYPSSVGCLPKEEVTIPQLLKEKGYYSALIGKWHLGHNECLPLQRGFDYFFGTPYSHDEGYPGPFPINAIWPPVPLYRNDKIIEQPVNMELVTQRMESEAKNFINKAKKQSTPFFVQMSYHETHIPVFSNEKFQGTSRRGKYGDMMTQMDNSIGSLIQHLKDIGEYNNTIVMYTSDNGAWPDAVEPFSTEKSERVGGSNGPFREGKGSTWEGGMRVPMMISWPERLKSKQIVQDVTSHLDFFPFLMEVASINMPANLTLDGRSLKELLSFEEREEHKRNTSQEKPVFFYRDKNIMAVRIGQLKAHFITRSGFGNERPIYHNPPLLFNVEEDPSEEFPMDVNEYEEELQAIIKIMEHQKNVMSFAPSQFDNGGSFLGQDWSIVPCCNKDPWGIFSRPPSGMIDMDILASSIWDQCWCNWTNSTVREPFQHPDDFHDKKFRTLTKSMFYDTLNGVTQWHESH